MAKLMRTVELKGDIDHHAATALKKKLDAFIAASEGDVVLDFSGVGFMDSSGIGLLIGRYKKLRAKGATLYAKNLNAQLTKVFRISGLSGIIKKL